MDATQLGRPRPERGAAGGTRQGLMTGRSTLRSDSAVLLGLRARRRTTRPSTGREPGAKRRPPHPSAGAYPPPALLARCLH